MFGLGMGELLIILVIVIIVFGATRLPMIGQGLGRGIKNFKKEVKGAKKILNKDENPDDTLLEKETVDGEDEKNRVET